MILDESMDEMVLWAGFNTAIIAFGIVAYTELWRDESVSVTDALAVAVLVGVGAEVGKNVMPL